jgi:signal transduction histidine kinase
MRPGRKQLRSQLLLVVAREPGSPSRRAVLAGLLVAALITIGVIDSATGSTVTFGAAYLVPVVAAAVLCGTPLAAGVAATAAVVWSSADAILAGGDYSVRVPVNSVLRFIILGLIVVLVAALRDALLEARRSERRSQDFLAFAAHQLRTPTAAASAAAQTLLARGGSPDDEELLVGIVHETSRAGRLVGAVLQFLRTDHHGELPRVSVGLDDVCREAVTRSREVGSVVSVQTFLGADPPPVVEANPEALIEAVCCLLENAGRHARTTVQVTTALGEAVVEVIVADDGPGLPNGHEEEAFAPFVSLDGKGGTGLGLAIARGLVEGQGGTLRYDGGEFVLRLPMNDTRR